MDWQGMSVDGLTGWVCGDGSPPAVVLHGGPGLEDYMRGAAEEVRAAADGRRRVVHYQQRGQAPSSLEGPLTLDQFVTDVVSVVDHVTDGGRAHLVGHSWGAHLAMHVAVRHPERVLGMLLLDPLGGVEDGGAAAMAPQLLERIGPRGRAALSAVDDDASLSGDEQQTERMRVLWPGYFADPASAPPMPGIRMSSRVNSAVLTDVFAALEHGYLARRLPQLEVPTVYQYGTASPIDPGVNARTAALMPRCAADVVDCGHFSWIERPGSVSRAMRLLLDATGG